MYQCSPDNHRRRMRWYRGVLLPLTAYRARLASSGSALCFDLVTSSRALPSFGNMTSKTRGCCAACRRVQVPGSSSFAGASPVTAAYSLFNFSQAQQLPLKMTLLGPKLPSQRRPEHSRVVMMHRRGTEGQNQFFCHMTDLFFSSSKSCSE